MPEQHAVILFHTTNHALRAEKALERAGIACKLIPVPRHLSSDCGVCVRIERAHRESARQAITATTAEIAGIHEI